MVHNWSLIWLFIMRGNKRARCSTLEIDSPLLISYGKWCIAKSVPCKEEECESCVNKFRCFGEDLWVKYVISDVSVPDERITDPHERATVRRHIKLLHEQFKELAKAPPAFWYHLGIPPHPALVSPVIKIVDSWANEAVELAEPVED
jgi:hypothetical protein